MLTVSSGSGSGKYTAGSIVTIIANDAPSGMVFDRWTATSGTIINPTSPSTTFTMPAGAVTVAAMFKNAPPAPTDMTALNARIDEVKNIQKGIFTDASWSTFQFALSTAQSVAGNTNATQDQVNSALSALNTTYANLRGKTFIFSTRYEATPWNWIMFILLFGWIWMWFI